MLVPYLGKTRKLHVESVLPMASDRHTIYEISRSCDIRVKKKV